MRDAAQTFVCNSGTEANEAALKFARKVARTLDPSGTKHELVSFAHSFHGRTLGALSATPNAKYQEPFAPLLPGCRAGAFNDIAGLETLITDRTAGVIIEPVQGEGGVYVAQPEFLAALRARCDAVGAVLIFDEIQSGLGRTGSLWAHAHPALSPTVHPDILTTAKALGNGVPIGAVLVSERVGIAVHAGDHGTTFGGNLLACAVGTHVLQRLTSPDGAGTNPPTSISSNVAARSQQLLDGLRALQGAHPGVIADVRGLGLLVGAQLKEPYAGRVGELVQTSRDRGVLVLTAGSGCVRFAPALTVSEETLGEGLKKFGEALNGFVEG